MELGGHIVSINEIERWFSRDMALYDMLPKAVRDDLKEGGTEELEKWMEEERAKRGIGDVNREAVKQREVD